LLSSWLKMAGCISERLDEGASYGFDAGIRPRIELNQSIKNYCAKQRIICVDNTFTATCDFETRRLKRELSNDGLHLNNEGYRTIAETIFSYAVKEIVTSYPKRIKGQTSGVKKKNYMGECLDG
jgi:hypothetical protein